jgi:hypothetical protein
MIKAARRCAEAAALTSPRGLRGAALHAVLVLQLLHDANEVGVFGGSLAVPHAYHLAASFLLLFS